MPTNGVPHLVLVHRYFWPDAPPYASMLREIAKHLASSGFRVTVLTAQPSYGDSRSYARAPGRETVDGIEVRRLSLLAERKDQTARRVLNLGGFATQVASTILRLDRPDIVMGATTPPMFVAKAAGRAARMRRASFVYHNQDIYPEVLGPPFGGWRGRLTATARRLDTQTGRNASRVVVLSDDMADSWRARGLPSEQLHIINNFDTSTAEELPQVRAKAAGARRLVFAGNVGRFQDVPGLIQAVNECPHANIELVVVGDGAELQRCVDLAGPRVHFAGRTSPDEALAWVATADAAVVSLEPGLYRYVYPSKTFTYLRAGAPLLVRVEAESELASTVRSKRLGWVAPPTVIGALKQTVASVAAASRSELEAMGSRALAASAEAAMPVALDRWHRLFTTILSERRG